MTIALAISFDSGILLCADAASDAPPRLPWTSTKIFTRSYPSAPPHARSIFVLSEPDDDTIAALQRSERALDVLHPAEQTIDRMRAAVEASLRMDPLPATTLFAALYSPVDRQCAVFRTRRTGLEEFVGYDCQGSGAYLAHYLIRDDYQAAQSMDSLGVDTAFSIATQTVQAIRDCPGGCGDATEVIVMYANGRASRIERFPSGTRSAPPLALLADRAS